MPERRYDQAAPPAYEPVRREGWDKREQIMIRIVQDYGGRVEAESAARVTKKVDGKDEVTFDGMAFVVAVLKANIGHEGTYLLDEHDKEYNLPAEVDKLPPGCRGFLFAEIERRDGSIRRDTVIEIPGLGRADFRQADPGAAEQAGEAEQEAAGPSQGGTPRHGKPYPARNGLDQAGVIPARAGRA